MQKKHSTKKLYNLTGYDAYYKAVIQLLTEARQKSSPELTAQDCIRQAILMDAPRWGVTREQIERRAAELDAADFSANAEKVEK